jgi:hypothetical protein
VLNKIQPNNQGEYAMADKNILEQMLGHLVNDDKQKAEELFHEYVVAKSREIYEQLIEAEMDDEEEEEEEVDEASEEEKEEGEDDLDENFEDIAYEGDNEEDKMFGGDATDDLAGEMGPEEDDEFADKDPEELFQDLDSIVDELQAKFDAMNGDDDMGDDDMGGMGDEEEMKDGFDLATVREYVEKVPAGHGAEKKGQGEKADGSASGLKFQKNDMGGTSANILGGKNGSDAGMQGMSGDLKGSGLSKGKPQLQDGGNVNTPGAKNGNAFSTKEPGHGAEKAGSKESADKGAAGLFRGRR